MKAISEQNTPFRDYDDAVMHDSPSSWGGVDATSRRISRSLLSLERTGWSLTS